MTCVVFRRVCDVPQQTMTKPCGGSFTSRMQEAKRLALKMQRALKPLQEGEPRADGDPDPAKPEGLLTLIRGALSRPACSAKALRPLQLALSSNERTAIQAAARKLTAAEALEFVDRTVSPKYRCGLVGIGPFLSGVWLKRLLAVDNGRPLSKKKHLRRLLEAQSADVQNQKSLLRLHGRMSILCR
eukprot:Polyplicarium_translucidae@DN1051_c0_g1_i1.p2